MNVALAIVFTRDAFHHHADPSGVHQPHRVCIRIGYKTNDLPAMAVIMHHEDKRYRTIKHYAGVKGLNLAVGWGQSASSCSLLLLLGDLLVRVGGCWRGRLVLRAFRVLLVTLALRLPT